MSKPKGGQGNRVKNRFTLAEKGKGNKMLTRQGQGRQSPHDEDESFLNRTLEDAGVLEENMTLDEKRDIFKVLQESKVNHEEEKMLVLNSHPSQSQGPVRLQSQPRQSSAPASQNEQVICLSQSSSGDSSDHSPIFPQKSPATKDSFQDSSKSHTADSPNSGFKEHRSASTTPKESTNMSDCGGKPVRQHTASVGNSSLDRGRGRGRAKPTKYTLPVTTPGKSPYFNSNNSSTNSQSCPINTNDQLSASLSPSSLQARPSSPQQHQSQATSSSLESPLSKPQDSMQRQIKGELPEESESISSPGDERFQGDNENTSTGIATDEVNTEVESVDMKEHSQNTSSSFTENQQNSPASVEDAEDIQDDDDEEPCKSKTLVGKFFSHVSPLESMVKKGTVSPCLSFLDELEQFRGNKCEWLSQAKKLVAIHRKVHWDKILSENSEWGPPIPDGGYNKETLFKQAAPKYSKLFANANDKQTVWTSGRTERSAKSQAMAKIHEATKDEWPEEEFHGLRKSVQQKKDLKTQDSSDSKQNNQNNAWKSKKKPDSTVEEDVGGDDSMAENVRWQSERVEQRNRFGDSDSEVTPESPGMGASGDVYDFDKSSEFQEVFNTKNKKNQRKNGKAPLEDVEFEPKMNQRPRGTNTPHSNLGGKNTKLRLKKGALAPPSEHAQSSSSKDPRNRGDCSEQFEGDPANTAKRNNVINETRWLNTEQSKSDSVEITPKKFFTSNNSPRVQPVPPRNFQSGLSKKPTRENRRANDFLSLPSTSGNNTIGRQHDEGNETAATPVKVACPICGRAFLTDQIETHASGCQEYSGSAVGEESRDETQDSEEYDKTVVGFLDKAVLPSHGGSEVMELKECYQCKEHFTPSDLKEHMKECIENVPSPPAGQKRASSLDEDDGPAKRTRLVE